jgi:cyclophilin family peptidyl-prolyl cis-trans isomerase
MRLDQLLGEGCEMVFLKKRARKTVLGALVVTVGLVVSGFSMMAQEVTKDEGKKSKPAALAYAEKLTEWKNMIRRLADLRVKFQSAKGVEVEQIRQQFALTVKEGDELLVSLRVAALAAFVESPNESRELTRFLVRMLKDALKQDRYEVVQQMAVTLIERKCDHRDIYDLAGHASFALNDFESAQKYLKAAELKNAITDAGRNHLAFSADYIKFWKEEQKIRQREAAADDLPRVKLTTSQGEVVIELFENEAPDTVGNFVSLVETGFYDSKLFHRVLTNFVAQTGCPKGDGTGDAGYSIHCECDKENFRKHFRGSLSMAHAGPDTGGSQFFITFRATPNLNGKHTVFGRIVTGFDTLVRLQRVDPDDEKARPVDPDRIVKAELLRKRDHEYSPNKVN